MPNWCVNTLTVWGDESELSEFRSKTVKDDPNTVSFNELFPMPTEIDNEDGRLSRNENETDAEYELRRKEFIKKHGTDSWYEWRVENWGTKWEGSQNEIYSDSPDELILSFETAWAPPSNWVKRVAMRFPNLSFRLVYMETGNEIAGKLLIDQGEISEDEGEPIYTDHYDQEVYYDSVEEVWKYLESGDVVEEDDFYPMAVNPFE